MYYTSLIGLEVQKSSEKTQTLPKDHLEHPLRPRWTTQIRIGPFWAVHKRFEVIWPSISKMVTWKPFPIEEAQHFTKPLKQLCVTEVWKLAHSTLEIVTYLLKCRQVVNCGPWSWLQLVIYIGWVVYSRRVSCHMLNMQKWASEFHDCYFLFNLFNNPNNFFALASSY